MKDRCGVCGRLYPSETFYQKRKCDRPDCVRQAGAVRRLKPWERVLLETLGWSIVFAILIALLGACASDFDQPPEPECAQFPDVDDEFKFLLADAIPLLDPSAECIGQPHAVTIVSDPSEMPEVCHRSTGLVVGCNAIDMIGFPHMWILDCQDDPINTARHERLHTLLYCMDGYDDPNHERPVWDELGVR